MRILEFEDGNNVMFSCPKCGRNYNHRSNLSRHLRLECGIGPRYQCEVCQRRFKHRHHMTDHLKRVHQIIQIN